MNGADGADWLHQHVRTRMRIKLHEDIYNGPDNENHNSHQLSIIVE